MPRSLQNLFLNHADAYLLSLMIAGLCLALHGALNPQNLVLIGAISICYWWGFALNDYFDAPFDALDTAKAQGNFFVQNQFSQKQIITISLIVLLPIAFLFAAYGWHGFLVFLIGLGVMWAYSAPPLRLKTRAGFDLWTHMLFVQTFPYALLLFVLQLPLLPVDGVLLIFFLLGSLTAQLEQQVRDFQLDSQNESNFTVRFGLKNSVLLLRTMTFCFVLLVCGAILFGLIPLWLVPYALIGLPVMLHRFWRDWQAPRSETLVRLSILGSMLYTGLLWGLRFHF